MKDYSPKLFKEASELFQLSCKCDFFPNILSLFIQTLDELMSSLQLNEGSFLTINIKNSKMNATLLLLEHLKVLLLISTPTSCSVKVERHLSWWPQAFSQEIKHESREGKRKWSALMQWENERHCWDHLCEANFQLKKVDRF